MFSFFSASISIKNVNFIPKGNLIVKTETTPTETQQKLDTTLPYSSNYHVNSETKVMCVEKCVI